MLHHLLFAPVGRFASSAGVPRPVPFSRSRLWCSQPKSSRARLLFRPPLLAGLVGPSRRRAAPPRALVRRRGLPPGLVGVASELLLPRREGGRERNRATSDDERARTRPAEGGGGSTDRREDSRRRGAGFAVQQRSRLLSHRPAHRVRQHQTPAPGDTTHAATSPGVDRGLQRCVPHPPRLTFVSLPTLIQQSSLPCSPRLRRVRLRLRPRPPTPVCPRCSRCPSRRPTFVA